MTALAPTLQAFFTDRLIRQRQASANTIAAYRDTMRLLLVFATRRTAIPPSRIDIATLDAPLISAFLDHLEQDRGNSVRTRNARLAALHALFGFAALRHPEHADTIARVLAIPPKRYSRTIVAFLTDTEAAAVLAAADTSTWTGRRDRALLALALHTGHRASELIGLACQDVHLATGAHASCHGKGRKERITPLSPATVAILRAWLAERGSHPTQPLFPTRRGTPLSRDALERLVAKYTHKAAQHCPSLTGKKVTPHVLRHTAAMRLLHAGVDITVIALWLGHESTETTQIYLAADLALKEQALAKTRPLDTSPGRFKPTDQLLAFLEGL